MGKVFSWKEVKNGQVPKITSYDLVVSRVRRDLENSSAIVGAILCGSVAQNSFNERSDVDCLVVYNHPKREELTKVLHGIYIFAKKLYVPVELIPVDSEIVSTHMHHIGLPMLTHIGYAVENGGLIKRNPLPLFFHRDKKEADDVANYVRNKLRRIEKGITSMKTMDTNDYHRFLQKALEAPMQIARQLLWWYQVDMVDDKKNTVVKKYSEIASGKELELFIKVLNSDREYFEALKMQVKKPSKDEYKLAIERVEKIIPYTLEYIRLIALSVLTNNRSRA